MPPLPPLQSRSLSSGLAERTLRNLDFIKNATHDAAVHPVTQVVNSLLGLLVFPVGKEQPFFNTFSGIKFHDECDLAEIRATLIEHLPVPSLQVAKFHRCPDLKEFFTKVRNAISHKHIEFSGDPDSRVLADVVIRLKDCKPQGKDKPCGPFDWDITLSAADLENLIRHIGKKIIELGL
jgi:hypothetical protein